MSETTAMSKTAAQHTEQLIWLGAGSATEPAGLIANANQVLLVEARKAACQQLTAQFSANSKVSVKQAVISLDGGEVNFTEYNLAEFSALSPLTGLTELFPGLTAVKSRPQPSLTLSELLTPLALSGNNNTLVLDIADLNLALLKQLQASGQLERFNQLYLQGSNLALYQGAATLTQLNSWLAQHGFMLQAQDNTDPDLPWLQFGVNPLWQALQQAQQQSAALQQQLAAAEQQAVENKEKHQQQVLEQKHQFEQKLAELTQQLTNAVSEKETLQQQFSAAKVAAEKTQAELNSQLAGKDAELKQALQQLETANQQLSSVKKQLEQQAQVLTDTQSQLKAEIELHATSKEQLAKVQSWLDHRKKQAEELEREQVVIKAENELLKSQQPTRSTMAELQASIEALISRQGQQLQQATNALGQHISKTHYEQETNLRNVLALQQFWQFGEQPLTPGAWSMQADTLNCLIKQLNSEHYNLIIEFGSGDSTVVLAKALQQQSSKAGQGVVQHSVHDLPAKIVSFEQNEHYLQQTKQALSQYGVADFVDLALAPLVPAENNSMDENAKTQLFYDCQSKLQKLAKIFAERQIKILVIVDGPASPEQEPFIRYPALPILLNAFSAHKLHIVLDDSNREAEQQVLAKWSEMLQQRGLTYNVKNWPTVKGAALISVSS